MRMRLICHHCNLAGSIDTATATGVKPPWLLSKRKMATMPFLSDRHHDVAIASPALLICLLVIYIRFCRESEGHLQFDISS
mmetsp:Transcript_30746/g.60438  ORF Transcript_30746/g.60438 Transcript_30746/m.60438 type:complete len:81 (+) Transcript_30746:215-457(+)